MKVARFSIESKIRWLLPLEVCSNDLEYSFYGSQSVKHLVESVGIPHTEIGEIRTNDGSIGLDYLVQLGQHGGQSLTGYNKSQISTKGIIKGPIGHL